jgi:hypothetical protein
MIEDLPDYPALQAIQNALWHVSDVRGAAVMVGSGFSTTAERASPSSKRPPLWSDMVSAMKAQLGPGSLGADNPLRLAEEFRALLGQAALDGLIRDLVPDAEWLPGEAHTRLLELPWSDVLSTNWDTLLERAKTELTERSYDLVYKPEDIPRTRSPRIIKLHGTLPSHTPFIFAEEDYRTYPAKFAPFVNLTQHVLLENELLLLGFSGDDPNFLSWAGWVRDQLGTSARKIRLAGVLNLSPARRRYLENLNVTPIDLAPLVDDVTDVTSKRAEATRLLLESLHSAKPKPLHVWERSKRPTGSEWSADSAEARVAKLVADWKCDREAAPDWLLAPYFERSRLREETTEYGAKALADAGIITPDLRTRIVSELAWRLDASHYGVPEWAWDLLSAEAESTASSLSIAERVLVLRLIGYAAIERRDTSGFSRFATALEKLAGDHPEADAWAAYLRGLWSRDSLDLASIETTISRVKGADPVWKLRQASLHCLLNQSSAAACLVRDAVLDIRRRRALDRRSLWLISREAWAQFLWRSLSLELPDEPDSRLKPVDEWPVRYQELRIDPWKELNNQDHEIRSHHDRERRYSGEERTHFEAGHWTPKARISTHWVADWVIKPEWSVRRLCDWIGLPSTAGMSDIMESRLNRTVQGQRWTSDEATIWRICSYIRSNKGDLIDSWFGRINVAAMPAPLVGELVTALSQSVEYLVKSLKEAGDPSSSRVQALRTRLELLSRLSVRSEPDRAVKLFELGVSIVERGIADHWWLFEPIKHLIVRSLSAIPLSKRGELVGQMLTFPLSRENRSKGNDREWPDFADEFRQSSIKVERPTKEWDTRIGELIGWVERDCGLTRHHAILRLWLLNLKGVLTDNEARNFATALWAQRTGPEGLPKDQFLYPASFLQLPEPKPGMAKSAFDVDVVQPLLAGKAKEGDWESLAYIGSEIDKGRAVPPITPKAAMALIMKAMEGNEPQTDSVRYEAIVYGLLPLVKLNDEVAGQLWECASNPEAVDALLFLPFVVAHSPSRSTQAVARLRRAMNSREFDVADRAFAATKLWASKVGPEDFPASLSSSVALIISIRRDPGLFRALHVAGELLRKGLLSEEDIESVLDGLSALLIETKYDDWRQGDFRTSTLTYVRANAYRLAQSLRAAGYIDQTIDDWITAGKTDPVPEVRFAEAKLD